MAVRDKAKSPVTIDDPDCGKIEGAVDWSLTAAKSPLCQHGVLPLG
jgi:hypothetical protein